MQLSIEFANQRNYLDELFRIYPTIPQGIRDINENRWKEIEIAFNKNNSIELLNLLLSLDLFPIKDSYVAYLKRDKGALERNPATANRLYGRLREMGLNKIYEECSAPKETNRQIGPLFKRWLLQGTLGAHILRLPQFVSTKDNAILYESERITTDFARENLNYSRNKGLDFVARFNSKYIIGEAKFLTDFGGHQNAQFDDAISTLNTTGVRAIIIAILDGVLYIKGRSKMHKSITTTYREHNIMSALVLREFLHSI